MHDITASIEFQMSLLLFVALSGYLIASRIGQPAVVGEILVGMVIGPSVLGWITYTTFVSSVAHLGAVILLFVIGLEFKLKDIAKIKYGVIALSGIIIPWLGGYFLAVWFGFDGPRAMLIGVALCATSIAVTADTLKEIGKLKTEAAKAIIGAAVIDDVLALMALSVTNQMSAGTISFAMTSLALLKSFGFLIVGALLGHFVLTRFVNKLDGYPIAKKYPEFVFIFAMMIAFLYGMMAELAGLSAIVGSFIAGVSLEGVGLKFSRSFKEGSEYLRIIFASVFFVSLGIIADVKALTPNIIGYLLLLSVVAVATKVVACGLPAKIYGLSTRDSLVVGFGMAPRGEVAMIIALLGLNQGIIDQPNYVALVLMSLLTTIVTPLVFRFWLYKGETT